MDTNALKAFIEVAETGSFSNATERLHLTQPAVSKRIATLENQLGTRLIDRIGRRISLTQAGDALLPRARLVLANIEDAQRTLTNLSGSVSGRLHLGISHHLGLHRLPPLLKQFSQRFSEVTLDIHFLASEAAYDAVLHGRVELAMTTLAQVPVTRIKAQTVWPDPLHFVAAPDHPLTACDKIPLATLSRHAAILPELSTFTGLLVKTLFDEAQVPLSIRLCSNYLETIRMMVSIGLGWSLLPETLATPPLQRLTVHTPAITRQLGVIYHQERTLSNSARAFLELLGIKPNERHKQCQP